ncbi:MAG TPA: transcription antitermination factor NusB [Rhizomicrobium sp.]|jgi:N utilization substance protein B|nr:transcription antitermination factor NusB [Rhizomicrobium sp.]
MSDTPHNTPQHTPSDTSAQARQAARLAAVQAIYQMELTERGAEEVIEEFGDRDFVTDKELWPAGAPDEEFFGDIVRGVPQYQDDIDRVITQGLAKNWSLKRIDSILRAILRAGVFELIVRKDVPAKVVIDQYMELAHAFFEGDEPSFVNAVLDKTAHRKRAAEFGETPPDDEIQF